VGISAYAMISIQASRQVGNCDGSCIAGRRFYALEEISFGFFRISGPVKELRAMSDRALFS